MTKKLRSVYADYAEFHKAWSDIRQSRLNEITAAVNKQLEKEKFSFCSIAEEKYYEYLVAEADALEEYSGVRPVFEMGEIDYDDPVLDIYE